MNKTLSMFLLSLSLFAVGCSEVVADDAESGTASVTSAATVDESDCRKAGGRQTDLAEESDDVRKAGKEQQEFAAPGESDDVRKAGDRPLEYAVPGESDDVRKAGKDQEYY